MSLKGFFKRAAEVAIAEAPKLIAKANEKAAAEAGRRQAEANRLASSAPTRDRRSLDDMYGGFTVDEWDRKWIRLGNLENLTVEKLKPYNKSIGLYKATEGGVVKYIGRAVEYNNGGFRKRLRDYVRPSDSGRKHLSGQSMNSNSSNLDIYILIMGNSVEQVENVKRLERAMIQKYGNVSGMWNVQR